MQRHNARPIRTFDIRPLAGCMQTILSGRYGICLCRLPDSPLKIYVFELGDDEKAREVACIVVGISTISLLLEGLARANSLLRGSPGAEDAKVLVRPQPREATHHKRARPEPVRPPGTPRGRVA